MNHITAFLNLKNNFFTAQLRKKISTFTKKENLFKINKRKYLYATVICCYRIHGCPPTTDTTSVVLDSSASSCVGVFVVSQFTF